VVLVTDGQVANEDQVVRAVAERAPGVRIHTVGIDRAVNAGLLDRLARTTGGRADLVESEDRLDEVLTAVRRRLSPPVLCDVAIEGAGIDWTTLAANTAADVHAGVPLVVYGRVLGATPPATVTVIGQGADGSPWRTEVEAVTGPDAARALWAKARLRALEDDYVAHGGDTQSIVDVSLATGVLCRFTAFVAESEDGPVDAAGVPERVVQPVSYPSGWAAAGVVAAAAPAPPPSGSWAPAHLCAVAPTDFGGGVDELETRDAFWAERPASLADRCRALIIDVEQARGGRTRRALAARTRALARQARAAGEGHLARALDALAGALASGRDTRIAGAVERLQDALGPRWRDE
jgi:Ca-activated chloride channel family protein